ncbi:MAG: hypothetical protein L0312_28170, partial [Acidobacteria bacterium]|nr:hypothetical protein [Acidobacteriota bacterium]
SGTARYWRVRPFKDAPHQPLEGEFKKLASGSNAALANAISEWRDNPFRPHLVARNRPIAYMKFVVLKYVENLIAWGDSLFRRDTMESINEALQYYVLANHILGPRAQFVPKRGEIKSETYTFLEAKWDEFSNALVELENIFPYSSVVSASEGGNTGNLLGVGTALYFCIPNNEKLLESWDTVADRLFKIRHCMNLDGVERKLALFAPPIDPAVLVNAVAKGLSISAILADLSSPPPIYRFSYLLQRANDFCAEVKALGSALLSAWEKRDGEEIGRIRASHETTLLGLMTGIRERQVLEATANLQGLLKARELNKRKLDHYLELLGETVSVPDPTSLDQALTVDSTLPADTSIPLPEVEIRVTTEEGTGVMIDPVEKEELEKNELAHIYRAISSAHEALSGAAHFFPTASIEGEPFGIGTTLSWGGSNVGSAISAVGRSWQMISDQYAYQATSAGKFANFIRREQDWTFQAHLAAREIIQIDKQIAAAEIRIQIAHKELEHHRQQIKNAEDVQTFLQDKLTNQELYDWMKEQLRTVYKASYNLAYFLAAMAEKAYRYEMGNELVNFIQAGGYWNDGPEGFLSGERLHLALR